jgi:hypothetical protein
VDVCLNLTYCLPRCIGASKELHQAVSVELAIAQTSSRVNGPSAPLGDSTTEAGRADIVEGSGSRPACYPHRGNATLHAVGQEEHASVSITPHSALGRRSRGLSPPSPPGHAKCARVDKGSESRLQYCLRNTTHSRTRSPPILTPTSEAEHESRPQHRPCNATCAQLMTPTTLSAISEAEQPPHLQGVPQGQPVDLRMYMSAAELELLRYTAD